MHMFSSIVVDGKSIINLPCNYQLNQFVAMFWVSICCSFAASGSATVWFDEVPVFGFSADDGKWVHPSEDCGRDNVPVPRKEGRHQMWNTPVESRSKRLRPEVGSQHPCHFSLITDFLEPIFAGGRGEIQEIQVLSFQQRGQTGSGLFYSFRRIVFFQCLSFFLTVLVFSIEFPRLVLPLAARSEQAPQRRRCDLLRHLQHLRRCPSDELFGPEQNVPHNFLGVTLPKRLTWNQRK